MHIVRKIACVCAVLACTGYIFAQEADAAGGASSSSGEPAADANAVESSHHLELGKSGTLGIEASTAFVADLDDGSTGLETNVGLELYLPLFPAKTRGVLDPNGYEQPGVRLLFKNLCFQWLETYATVGGNYKQDNFNSWVARPLVLSFDSLSADVVWKHFFVQVAGTTNPMEQDKASLCSIFDKVIDTDDRWYIKKEYALYYKTRYNKLDLPMLGTMNRNFIDKDYDYSELVSGQMGAGVEYRKFTVMAKAASLYNGEDNDNNAWMFGLDAAVYPTENISIKPNVIAAVNCQKDLGTNPFTAGISADYKIPLKGTMVLKPFVGFDYAADTSSSDWIWEAGGGAYLYFRGTDYLASHRDIDYDEIVPVGISAAMNAGQQSGGRAVVNAVVSGFELADRNAVVPNLGYFFQFEAADITASDDVHTAVCGQVEYLIANKILPYVFGKYYPEMSTNKEHYLGNTLLNAKIGCYFTPIQYFSLDVNYGITFTVQGENSVDKGQIGATCTIRL